MSFSKKQLYQTALQYIYAHNFEDLKVLSKQFLYTIAFPSYANNAEREPFSIISFDFNNMRKLNENGKENGDTILHDTIALIQSIMPEDSYIVRSGGDEFFIFLKEEKEKALIYQDKLHTILQKYHQQIKGASVSSYCVHSSEAENLAEMLNIADSAISVIKKRSRSSEYVDQWDIFKNKITENITDFFKALRFHKFPMDTQHIKNLSLQLLDSYDLLIKQESDIPCKQKTSISTPMSFAPTFEKAKELEDLFLTNKKVSQKQIEKISQSSYKNLLDHLSRDPVTGHHNKSYLINYLLNKKGKSFDTLLISSTFVKACNSIHHAHCITDVQIKEQIDQFSTFVKEHIPDQNNSIISLDGGDILYLVEEKSKLDPILLKDFFLSQTSQNFSPNNLLRLVPANSFRKINKDNFEEVIQLEEKECNANKIPLLNHFLSNDIVCELLVTSLQDSAHYYQKIVADPKSPHAKRNFLELALKSILDIYPNLDVEHTELEH